MGDLLCGFDAALRRSRSSAVRPLCLLASAAAPLRPLVRGVLCGCRARTVMRPRQRSRRQRSLLRHVPWWWPVACLSQTRWRRRTVAGIVDGPILLTDPLQLSSVTSAELTALGATQVYVVGGTSAVSAHVAAQIGAITVAGVHPTVSRLSGATRYATAQAVAQFPNSGGVGVIDGEPTAFLVSGTTFPDALAASPVADAARLPIILTDPTTLSPQVAAIISADHIQHVVIVGGTVFGRHFRRDRGTGTRSDDAASRRRRSHTDRSSFGGVGHRPRRIHHDRYRARAGRSGRWRR